LVGNAGVALLDGVENSGDFVHVPDPYIGRKKNPMTNPRNWQRWFNTDAPYFDPELRFRASRSCW
jgi:hypothetical protein